MDNASQHVCTYYGSDVDTTVHGSGFPLATSANPYAKFGWNLNVLPGLPQSLLKHVSGISGNTQNNEKRREGGRGGEQAEANPKRIEGDKQETIWCTFRSNLLLLGLWLCFVTGAFFCMLLVF